MTSPTRLATITQHRSFAHPNFSYPPTMRQAHRPQARKPVRLPRFLLSRPIFLAALLSLILFFAFLPGANADLPAIPQSPATAALSNLGDRVQLGPIWLIHPGDNPAWASPTGFDCLPALTRLPAADIADTAQRFGQEDDITVLTIRCA